MVIDERIGAVEDALAAHELRISALEDQSQLITALLTEIRDDVRAQRGRLDGLIAAASQAIALVGAALARVIDAIGHRVLLALLLAIAGLLARLGIVL